MRIRDWTFSIKPNVQMCTPASGEAQCKHAVKETF